MKKKNLVQLVIVMLIFLVAVACTPDGGDAGDSGDTGDGGGKPIEYSKCLQGTWNITGEEIPVTIVLNEDGSFTYTEEETEQNGSWDASKTYLTMDFGSLGDFAYKYTLSEDKNVLTLLIYGKSEDLDETHTYNRSEAVGTVPTLEGTEKFYEKKLYGVWSSTEDDFMQKFRFEESGVEMQIKQGDDPLLTWRGTWEATKSFLVTKYETFPSEGNKNLEPVVAAYELSEDGKELTITEKGVGGSVVYTKQ